MNFLIWILTFTTVAFGERAEVVFYSSSFEKQYAGQKFPALEDTLSMVNECIANAKNERLDPWVCYSDSVPLSREAFTRELDRANKQNMAQQDNSWYADRRAEDAERDRRNTQWQREQGIAHTERRRQWDADQSARNSAGEATINQWYGRQR